MRLPVLMMASVVGVCGFLSGPQQAYAEAGSPAPTARPIVNPQVLTLAGPDFSGCPTLPTADRTEKFASGVFSQTPMGQGHPTCNAFVTDFLIDKSWVNANNPLVAFDGWDSVREDQTPSAIPLNATHGPYTYWVKQPITKAECEGYKQYLHVFHKKSGESTFSSIGGGGMVATWDPGGMDGKGLGGPLCRLKGDASFKAPPKVLPPTGTEVDTYRVVLYVTKPGGQLIISSARVKS
jgi:hypothetical protein